MIVFKWWETTKKRLGYTTKSHWEGWFLFGIIPLFVRLTKTEKYPSL